VAEKKNLRLVLYRAVLALVVVLKTPANSLPPIHPGTPLMQLRLGKAGFTRKPRNRCYTGTQKPGAALAHLLYLTAIVGKGPDYSNCPHHGIRALIGGREGFEKTVSPKGKRNAGFTVSPGRRGSSDKLARIATYGSTLPLSAVEIRAVGGPLTTLWPRKSDAGSIR